MWKPLFLQAQSALQQLKRLPSIANRLEHTHLDIVGVIESFRTLYTLALKRRGYVMILTSEKKITDINPNWVLAPRVYSKGVYGSSGEIKDVTFDLDTPIPAGAWVVYCGEGAIINCRVGNHYITAHHDFQSPACILAEEVIPSVKVGVQVKL